MIVGVLRIELLIYEALTLKDKRRVVKSLKDRISARFRAAVAEVDALDLRQRAVLGVAVVGNENGHIQSCLDTILDFVQREHRASVVAVDRQTYY